MTIHTKEQYESDLRLLNRLKKPIEVQIANEKPTTDNYVVHISTIDRLHLLFGVKLKNMWIERHGKRLTR